VSEEIAAEAGLSGFGRWLARERELRGLSRDEVTRATKLAPGTVEALESGEEARMPPRAYVVGYLRSYAVAAGLDPDEVVLRYEEVAGDVPAKRRRAGTAAIPPKVVLAVVAAVAAGGAVIWALLR